MHFDRLKRRELMSLLGGAAAWPLAARAEQPEQMRRIVVLMALPEDDREGREQADALRDGLKALRWMDGRNIHMEFHWNVGHPDRAGAVARDVVAARPDLIVSHAASATRAVVQLTKTIPIVFVNVADPIGLGFVASYARPGSNVTGFTNFEPSISGKWVEVLKEVDPRIRRVAILFNPDTAARGGKYFLPSFKAAGAVLGVEPIETPVRDVAGIERAIAGLAREPNGGTWRLSLRCRKFRRDRRYCGHRLAPGPDRLQAYDPKRRLAGPKSRTAANR
jgi:putative ABC transport system substrate-binding protein